MMIPTPEAEALGLIADGEPIASCGWSRDAVRKRRARLVKAGRAPP
jgi:hypothetical protein